MDFTPNYNLKKPALNDTADIEDINSPDLAESTHTVDER